MLGSRLEVGFGFESRLKIGLVWVRVGLWFLDFWFEFEFGFVLILGWCFDLKFGFKFWF